MTLNEDINLGAITEALNNKIDLPTGVSQNNVRVVIETYQNGTDWYRVYSDGWCEQGGQVPSGNDNDYTGTLLKPYADINYQIGFTSLSYNTSSYNIQWQYIAIYPITSSTFGCKAINFARSWRACGYINLGGS